MIDAHLSGNKLTGIGRYLNELILSLNQIPSDLKLSLILYSGIQEDHPLFPFMQKVDHISTPIDNPSIKQHLMLPPIQKDQKPDLYHHPHFDLPLGISCPSVITVHDLKYIRHPQFFQSRNQFKAWYMKKMLGSSLKRCSRVIAVSEATKFDILSVYNVDPEKIRVIHHGIQNYYFNNKTLKTDSSVLTQLGVDSKYVLFVGERRPHKNIPRLIEAYSKLDHFLKEAYKLVIVGKSYADYNEPEKRIKQLDLDDSVIFTDSVSDEILKILYRNSSLFVLPSLYEGFGFPVVEAMASKVPVVASNVTSLPEIVGDAGLLCNPEDVQDIKKMITLMLTNNELKKKYINLGYKWSKHFTWERSAKEHLNVYHEVYRTCKS